jgi:hypothetical protein
MPSLAVVGCDACTSALSSPAVRHGSTPGGGEVKNSLQALARSGRNRRPRDASTSSAICSTGGSRALGCAGATTAPVTLKVPSSSQAGRMRLNLGGGQVGAEQARSFRASIWRESP